MGLHTLETEYKALNIRVLEELPRAAEARKMLEKICWQVQPIMQRRRWRVPLVAEFLPRSSQLLGLNHNAGEKIEIRMRRSKDGDFLDYDNMLGTMLHELVHNEIGPHNARFYKLLDELQGECEDLLNKGIGGRGAGFDLPGSKLSTESHNPAHASDSRMKGLKAAEERLRKQHIMSGSGQRLGGAPPPADKTPAQMAAEAAIRRAKDDVWCPSGREQAPADRSDLATTEGNDNTSKPPDHVHRRPKRKRRFCSAWACLACTFLNNADCVACSVCETPAPESCGCSSCGQHSADKRVFTQLRPSSRVLQKAGGPCPICTYENVDVGKATCSMCGAELVTDATASDARVIIDLD